jgi:hypothetical protein
MLKNSAQNYQIPLDTNSTKLIISFSRHWTSEWFQSAIMPLYSGAIQMPRGTEAPRLSIVLTREEMKELETLIPWGGRNKIFQNLTRKLIEAIKTHGADLMVDLQYDRARISFEPKGQQHGAD